MATVSKSKRKNIPGKTKNGKTKLTSLSLTTLQEMVGKTNRPRDKDKIQRFINKIIKEMKKSGLQLPERSAIIES